MKKVLIVNSYYDPTIIGGAEISTQLLAEGLTKDYKVYVLTTGGHKSGLIKEEKNGVEIYRIPCMNLYWPAEKKDRNNLMKLGWHLINAINPRQYYFLKNLLNEIKPDFIHTQNLNGIGTYIWSLSYKLRIPVVHTTRDYALFEPVKNTKVNKILSYINRRRSKYVNCSVGISQFIMKKHEKNGFFSNSHKEVVHNVVKSKNYERRERKEGEPLVIGYFGQLEEIKGVKLLAEVIQFLEKNVVSKLVICGTGQLEKELQKKAEQDGRIVLMGKIPLEEVNQLMAQIDVTIVPSIWEEPFGRVIIESYNQGTPVIATAVGGIPELIVNKELLIAKDDREQLIKSIEKFASLNNKQISENIRESLAASRYYHDNIALYNRIYKNISSGDKFDG
ncbi:glycosyltransferase family 4 protein [Bacillus paramycoides]|uniref:glycosyltransferase family 4 protein n=1 Tax=Bacillus paramycoides TaxID=2026194 RepID=UPI00380D733B